MWTKLIGCLFCKDGKVNSEVFKSKDLADYVQAIYVNECWRIAMLEEAEKEVRLIDCMEDKVNKWIRG